MPYIRSFATFLIPWRHPAPACVYRHVSWRVSTPMCHRLLQGVQLKIAMMGRGYFLYNVRV